MKELARDLFVITEKGRLSTFMPAVNLYVLAGSDGLVFDAGYGTRSLVDQAASEIEAIRSHFDAEGRPFRVARILPSHAHPDHISGLRELRKRLGLTIVLGEATAEIIRSKKDYNRTYNEYREPSFAGHRGPAGMVSESLKRAFLYVLYNYCYGKSFIPDPDEIIRGEGDISVNGETWRVMLTPGHASDHLSLYSPSRGALLGGDNILPHVTTWLGPPDSNLERYVATLERIAGLDPLDVIYPAHGKPITSPRRRIDQLLAARRRRTDQIMKLVRSSDGITMDDIIAGLYLKRVAVISDLGRGWVILTLQKLLAEGAIAIDVKNGNRLIRAVPPPNSTDASRPKGTGARP